MATMAFESVYTVSKNMIKDEEIYPLSTPKDYYVLKKEHGIFKKKKKKILKDHPAFFK